ncbi:MAG: GNAT family N-acetyltransferase [Actinomycetia bacterium]|nr:GNAT family N-acetyltransferase [Actinomycetes bacterium]
MSSDARRADTSRAADRPPGVVVTRVEPLTADTRARVRALAAAVAERVGAPPLSEQTLLALGSADVAHWVATADGELVGYAQRADGVAEVAADIVDAGDARDVVVTAGAVVAADAGLSGDAVVADLLRAADADAVWAHGRRSPVAAVATALGYQRARELWQLRRPATAAPSLIPNPTITDRSPAALPAPLPSPAPVPPAAPDPAPTPVPPGVVIRPFRVGVDEPAWLALNAAAFAAHPEQGRWTMTDLLARENAAWFDPAGFLLAWRDAAPTPPADDAGDFRRHAEAPAEPASQSSTAPELLGFHWTKRHEDGRGEVYVIGVSPSAQGMGLGGALLAAGLDQLTGREVLLYVEGDNNAALRLYERFGFTRHDVDIQLRR